MWRKSDNRIRRERTCVGRPSSFQNNRQYSHTHHPSKSRQSQIWAILRSSHHAVLDIIRTKNNKLFRRSQGQIFRRKHPWQWNHTHRDAFVFGDKRFCTQPRLVLRKERWRAPPCPGLADDDTRMAPIRLDRNGAATHGYSFVWEGVETGRWSAQISCLSQGK